jgi:type III secretion protein C
MGPSFLSNLLRGAACALLLAACAAHAAPPPNAMRTVSITAREQPIGAFLQNLFSSIDVPANVSPQLTGNVNGTFSGPAEKVLRDVSRVYSLVTYYDGAVVHVVPASEIATRTFAVSRPLSDRVMREAAELGLPDTRNTLRAVGNGNLVAVGTRRFIEQIDELTRSQQASQAAAAAPPTPGMLDFRVFYLRYAWAQDTSVALGGRQVVVPGVASILRSLVGAHVPGAGARDVMLRPTLPSLKGQGLAGQGVPVSASAGDSARSSGKGVDALVAALDRVAQPAGDPIPMYDPGLVTIEAEPRLNAVIVRDIAERLSRYEQLIAALDVEPQSLEIEATIIDVNTDRLRELGIDWRWSNAGNALGFGGSVPVVGNGGVATVVLGSLNQFVARIRALQTDGAARVVSSPQVVTLSNVEAVFDNSSTFYVRVAGREQVDLFNVSAGTTLRVTPHVFRDQNSTRIKLLVNVEDGALTSQEVDRIPVVERSSINTQALIAEGESLLIGGMVRDSTSSSEDKIPGLGDVPVVGNLFKTKTKSTQRVERMFLITPRLAGTRPAGGSLPQSAPAPATAPTAPVLTAAAAAAPAASAAQAVPTAPIMPVAYSAPATTAPAPSVPPAAPALSGPVTPAPTPSTPVPLAAQTAAAPAARVAPPAPLPSPTPPSTTTVSAALPVKATPTAYAPPERPSVELDLDSMQATPRR